MQPYRPYQKIFPAHDTDIQAGYARKYIHNTCCIHCGEVFDNNKPIGAPMMFTELSNGKFVWWHVRPCCTEDDIYEKSNKR